MKNHYHEAALTTAVEMAGIRSLGEGQKVSFDIQPDAKGSKAVNLQMA